MCFTHGSDNEFVSVWLVWFILLVLVWFFVQFWRTIQGVKTKVFPDTFSGSQDDYVSTVLIVIN
jgi:hypothetical protein